MGLVAGWRCPCWSCCCCMSTLLFTDYADEQVVLVTWEICDIISGTMAMATDYVPQTWHSVLFFLVRHSLMMCD
jgi:hypothetical protein